MQFSGRALGQQSRLEVQSQIPAKQQKLQRKILVALAQFQILWATLQTTVGDPQGSVIVISTKHEYGEKWSVLGKGIVWCDVLIYKFVNGL